MCVAQCFKHSPSNLENKQIIANQNQQRELQIVIDTEQQKHICTRALRASDGKSISGRCTHGCSILLPQICVQNTMCLSKFYRECGEINSNFSHMISHHLKLHYRGLNDIFELPVQFTQQVKLLQKVVVWLQSRSNKVKATKTTWMIVRETIRVMVKRNQQ